MIRTRRLCLLVVALAWALPAAGEAGAGLAAQAGIATAHPLATQAGEEILAAGGNAFDAAVAISAALAVVEPFASGLGGGAFWLLHEAKSGRQTFVDAREVAPGAATHDMYLDEQGQPRPGATLNGPLAAGIPGQPAGLVHLARRYGRLPLAKTLAPAIRYAEEGVEVTRGHGTGPQVPRQRRAQLAGVRGALPARRQGPGGGRRACAFRIWRARCGGLRRMAATAFTGDRWRGSSWTACAPPAASGRWTTWPATKCSNGSRSGAEYRGMTIVSAPPPSAGGVALANVFQILSGYELGRLAPVDRKHLTIEAMRRAYRDRAIYLGDPAFVTMPLERLLSPFYADGQRTSILLDRATPSIQLSGILPEPVGGTNTTHFSVLDRAGNRVAGTLSINTWFGSAFIPPGTGVILNNEMDDFSIKTGVPNGFDLIGAEANSIAPGKRMLSSMSPTFLESDRGIAILGTPGGSRIISMVLLAALAWSDGADATQMVGLKRYHHQYFPDVVAYEEGAFTPDEKAALEAKGHKLELSERSYGNMQVVTWDRATGRVDAASDPRGGGDVTIY